MQFLLNSSGGVKSCPHFFSRTAELLLIQNLLLSIQILDVTAGIFFMKNVQDDNTTAFDHVKQTVLVYPEPVIIRIRAPDLFDYLSPWEGVLVKNLQRPNYLRASSTRINVHVVALRSLRPKR